MWIIAMSWESEVQDAYAPYETQEEAHAAAQEIAKKMVSEGELADPRSHVAELKDINGTGWGAQIRDFPDPERDLPHQGDSLVGWIDVQVLGPIGRHDK